ncbi:transposable element Tcb2 transposase [Trichonephila clavipes]|nr:transposable element Tcb2 transposase [Trichonephila clavipes]
MGHRIKPSYASRVSSFSLYESNHDRIILFLDEDDEKLNSLSPFLPLKMPICITDGQHAIVLLLTSGSETCHLQEDQAQDAPDRPVVEMNRHIVINAHVQPTASSAAIQAHVVPSLGTSVSSRTIRRHLNEGHLGSQCPIRVRPLTPTHRRLRLERCRSRGMKPGRL